MKSTIRIASYEVDCYKVIIYTNAPFCIKDYKMHISKFDTGQEIVLERKQLGDNGVDIVC